MKWFIAVGLMMVSLLKGARAEQEKFSSRLTPEELAAAGLAGLSPAQFARLNELVEVYKSGELATVRRTADEALVAKRAAEEQAGRAEAKAAAARVDAAKAEAAKAAGLSSEATKTETVRPAPAASLLVKAKNLLKPGPPVAETAAIESSISGKFRGWSARQILVLANGQRYQVTEKQSYYSPLVENPKVQIVPAAMAGYWLRFPELGAEVRVNLLGEK